MTRRTRLMRRIADSLPGHRHHSNSHALAHLADRVPAPLPAAIVGSLSLGAFTMGALAMGAIAIGALAVGRLVIGRARIRHLEIDSLKVTHLEIEREDDLLQGMA